MTVQQTADRVRRSSELRVVAGAEARVSVLGYERLEAQSWAPWLRFSRRALTGQLSSFPEDQFFAFDRDDLVGALSCNRISWDGDASALGTWDSVAGEQQDYRDTHDSDGNTLVLMSMSIARRSRTSGVARRLLDAARRSAGDRGLDQVIGDFRPSGYGSFKLRDDRDFGSYVDLRDPEGLPIDPWLRAVTRMGMRPLRIDDRAMVIDVGLRELDRLRRTSQLGWVRAESPRDSARHEPALGFPVEECESWEPAQTGTWYVHRAAARATYVESGLWGVLATEGSEG